MTDKQILKKAIEKAIKGGYIFPIPGFMFTQSQIIESLKDYYSIIFSHKFAKAFWGNEKVCMFCGKHCWDKNILSGCIWRYDIQKNRNVTLFAKDRLWLYHLTQMVRKSNPLKYVEKYL